MREVPHDPTTRPHSQRTASSRPLTNAEIEQHLAGALGALLSLQREDGHWCGELEGDSILQSEYLLMKWILGQEAQALVDGRPPQTLLRIVSYLRGQQRAEKVGAAHAAELVAGHVRVGLAARARGLAQGEGLEHAPGARAELELAQRRAAGRAHRGCNAAAESVDRAPRVGPKREPQPFGAQLGRGLEHEHVVDAALAEGHSGGEAGDSRADDHDGRRIIGARRGCSSSDLWSAVDAESGCRAQERRRPAPPTDRPAGGRGGEHCQGREYGV